MSVSSSGFFVTIEGVEGAGKSTLRTKLTEGLSTLVPELIVTREPGATAIGASIRSLLLDPSSTAITSLTELLLFSADRAQHLEEVVRPALARNALVLCDRFIHSTIAYQGYGRGICLEQLSQLNQFVTGGLKPHLVLCLDLPVEIGLERAAERARRASGETTKSAAAKSAAAKSDDWSRFEEQNISFHRKVREGFLELAKHPANNIVLLDASRSSDEVAADALNAIKSRYQN